MFDRLDTDPADAVGGGGPDETWVDRECPFDDDEDAPPLPEDVEFVEPSAGEWLESACAMRPGAGLLDALGEVVLSDVSADEAVTVLQEMQRVAAHVAGLEAALREQVTAKVVAEVQEKIAADADPDRPARPQFVCAEQVAWSEVAVALRLSPVTGESRILESQELMGAWRPMLAASLARWPTVGDVRAAGRPAVVMTYWNLIEHYGVESFARDLANAGGSGVVTPDLVPDDAEPWLAASDAHGLDRIFLVAPSSTDERIAKTAAATRGWLYATAVMGVTGTRTASSSAAPELVERIRRLSPQTLVGVGLGVSNGDQAAEVAGFADAVIVGSAFITTMLAAEDAGQPDDLTGLRAVLADLTAGVRRT